MKKSKFKNKNLNYSTLARPFQRRLYRTALILTKSHHLAIELVDETNYSAGKQYSIVKSENNFDFRVWLFQLLLNNFIHHGKK